MTDQGPTSEPSHAPQDLRGALVYSQEDGYKIITIQVQLFEGEQSHVMTHAYEILQREEAEHFSAQPPLVGIDLYHFPINDYANIMLTIESQQVRSLPYILFVKTA